MRAFLFVLSVALSLGLAPAARATPSQTGVPGTIAFAARLGDAGSPVDGTRGLTFKLWTHPSEGVAIWGESQEVLVAAGVLSARLGAVSPFPDGTFSQGDLWLEVSVGGTTLSPRLPLVSVPFAFRAEHAAVARTVANDLGAWSEAGHLRVGPFVPTATNAAIQVTGNPQASMILDNLAGAGHHLTLIAGEVSSGLRFNQSNRFFIGAQPYADRDASSSGTEVLGVDAAGNGFVGNAALGSWPWNSSYAYFGHKALDQTDAGNYALYQEPDGNTYLNAANGQRIRFRINNTTWAQLDAAGNFGIGGVAVPLDRLHVAGNIRVTGCIKDGQGNQLVGTCPSDARFKKNIASIEPVLDRLVRLRPVQFDWRTESFPEQRFSTARESGLIAQEAEKVLPELVGQDATGYRVVHYHKLPLLLVQALAESEARAQALERRVARLEALLSARR